MWNRSPVQVWCVRQGAQGWWPGMTLRDGMGREVWRRIRMENTCTSMADSWGCMAKKPPQYCKVLSLQLNFFLKKDSNEKPDDFPKVHKRTEWTGNMLITFMVSSFPGLWKTFPSNYDSNLVKIIFYKQIETFIFSLYLNPPEIGNS